MASQLTPARLKRLYRNVQKFEAAGKWQAALAAAVTAAGTQDRLFATVACEHTQLIPDVGFGAGIASSLRKGRAAILFAPELGEAAGVLKHAVKERIPLVLLSLAEQTVRGLEIPTITVEQADAVALFRVMQESLLHARLGAGPTWIVCRKTLRIGATAYMEDYLRRKQLLRTSSSKRVVSPKRDSG